jgi:hypothetical protein
MWGPSNISGSAGDASEIAQTAAASLATMAPADVSIHVAWPDGDNREGSRVRVELQYVHHGLPLLGLNGGLPLKAESTMQIVH